MKNRAPARRTPGAMAAAAFSAAVLLAGCGTSTVSRDVMGDGTAGEIVFPEPSSAWAKGGIFPNVDLLPEGRRRIAALAAQVQRDFKSVRSVRITGHADRLGTVAGNDALSVSRARTVRALFVQSGVPEGVMQVHGEGSRRPLVACPGGVPRAVLVACLQPNRRVEIEVAGES